VEFNFNELCHGITPFRFQEIWVIIDWLTKPAHFLPIWDT